MSRRDYFGDRCPAEDYADDTRNYPGGKPKETDSGKDTICDEWIRISPMPDSTRKTDEELKALWALKERATPTPWEKGRAGNTNIVHFDGDDIRGVGIIPFGDNLRYVIAAANALPDIILDLQASRERELELVEALKEIERNLCAGSLLTLTEIRNIAREVLARAEAEEKPNE